MYSYEWDASTGGFVLTPTPLPFSKEPRPVYYKELDILGFDKFWNYEKNDSFPYMWAEANKYYYRGRLVAKTKGGSIYTPPQIELLDEPEPPGYPLRFVDIPAMVEKNRQIMEQLTQETIKKVYNTYINYKNKVDLFHVSYSGGKDSEVNLDIVQRALPHNAFLVIFGDTGMEFPDTYSAVDNAELRCLENNIKFFRAKSVLTPEQSWALFGPPSNTIRWCCSVHKTAPQLLLLREITGKPDFKEMAFVGVRADESVKRSEYDYVSLGTKHKGQYSCNPILDWNSAEIYLYLYQNNLHINEAYKKGNSRAGCLVCPMSRDKSDFMRNQCYTEDVDRFLQFVKKSIIVKLETPEDDKRYFETGGWKLRNNGRDIKTIPNKYIERTNKDYYIIDILNPFTDWKTWIKTIGELSETEKGFVVKKNNTALFFKVSKDDNSYKVYIKRESEKEKVLLTKKLKQVFRKAAYCVQCRECEADCPKGCVSMRNGELQINDNCIHCSNCHKPAGGCLLYHSLELPKGNGMMKKKSLDCYADHAPKIEWIEEFFQLKNDFYQDNHLGSQMFNFFKRFLRHAELVEDEKLTDFAELIIDNGGTKNPINWALMLCNLAYTPEFNWYIKNVENNRTYTREELMYMLQDEGVLERGSKSITGAYKRILALPFGTQIGLGVVEGTSRNMTYYRESWQDPDERVILYSLYKFAEACGGYKQFTLTRLLDDSIDSEGVSPTQIFGLNRETMERILNSLMFNYPELIEANFTLGLDNINLKSDLSSKDIVIQLFA